MNEEREIVHHGLECVEGEVIKSIWKIAILKKFISKERNKMQKVKKFIGTMLASAFILSNMVMSVSAYWSPTGNREVLYYNFSIQTDEMVGCSSSSMQRLYEREWVVTVVNRANNRYGITYGMIDNNATEWDNALVSRTTTKSGTGNFGSTYYSSDSVGSYLYLGALIDERDLNKGVTSDGQWSTDASR